MNDAFLIYLLHSYLFTYLFILQSLSASAVTIFFYILLACCFFSDCSCTNEYSDSGSAVLYWFEFFLPTIFAELRWGHQALYDLIYERSCNFPFCQQDYTKQQGVGESREEVWAVLSPSWLHKTGLLSSDSICLDSFLCHFAVAPLGTLHGTPVWRSTPVEKHCLNAIGYAHLCLWSFWIHLHLILNSL